MTEYTTNSVRHGYEGLSKNGTLTLESGDKYEGSLENGVMAGFGRITYSKDDKNNREYYTGEFKNGKISKKLPSFNISEKSTGLETNPSWFSET